MGADRPGVGALGSGSALTPQVAAAWDAWQTGNATAGRRLRHHAEERCLGRQEAWTSTAVGRFPRPVLQRFTACEASELVLASDGARLTAAVLDDLPTWLAALRRWEHGRADLRAASGKVHDDVTVLRLRRSPPRIQPAPRRQPVRARPAGLPAVADQSQRAA